MLNRSRSWPVQSVVTLDPRGIVYSKIQTRNGLASGRTPDIVLEANERAWTRPDIFPSLDSRRAKAAEEKPKECQPKQLQFVDHYKLLDSTETADTEFAIRVPLEGASATRIQVPATRALPAEIPIISAQHEDSLLLNSYQIDLLRKKSYKKRDDVRSLRSTLERKPTTEFESIASNETKTTDIDDKGTRKKTTGRRDSSATPHLIRSYSLGYEQTEEKVNRTFKKFSLPTPQLKDIVDNPEEGAVKRKTVSDVKKVSTLTRHYYPEGGWGFVIVLCSVIVQTLCHGLQMASGVIMVKSAGKFKVDIVHTVRDTMRLVLRAMAANSFPTNKEKEMTPEVIRVTDSEQISTPKNNSSPNKKHFLEVKENLTRQNKDICQSRYEPKGRRKVIPPSKKIEH